MSDRPPPRWVWEQPDPGRSGAAGNLAKLFKNERVKQPGIFDLDAPSSHATVLAREVIQNSWDAAQLLRDDLLKEHIKEELKLPRRRQRQFAPPPFSVRFAFRRSSGGSKEAMIRNLALRELADRINRGAARDEVGLGESDCLDRLDEPDTDLEYLVVEEEAASGMFGRWEGDSSKMYQALLAIGFTTGSEGRGGSFGYGKAGLIRGSTIRTVMAYTCFRERKDEPGVTRRLLGVTYWGHHKCEGKSFTGFARMGGEQKSGAVVPFVNEEADRIAQRLGLKVRDPADLAQVGTTFLLVEPTVSPGDLVTAIERSWWPALEESSLQFEAEVIEPDGKVLCPRPSRNSVLRTFSEAYRIANSPGQTREGTKLREVSVHGEDLGRLGLVSDVDGWSYADQTGNDSERDIDHRNLVALVRKPRMVVEYLPVGWKGKPPYVRGVFVADDRINEDLRATEPKGHDAWDSKSADAPKRATQIAKQVDDRIKRHVRLFRKELTPPVRPAKAVELPDFYRLMKRVLSGRGKGVAPIPIDPRYVTIEPRTRLEAVGNYEIRVHGTVRFGLSEHYGEGGGGETPQIQVSIRYRFVEDSTASRDWATVRVHAPPTFQEVAECFYGPVSRSEPVVFKFETDPYRADWSGHLVVEADLAHPTDSSRIGA